MSEQNYTTSFTVDNSPEEVFRGVTNPRDWWSKAIEGETDRLGAVWYYHYKDLHRCVLKITEFEPNKKVVWHVLHNDFNFVKDKEEWNGNEMVFEISEKDGKTELHFTQVGLVPSYECYGVCSDSWGSYIGSSLRDLIVKGEGKPNPIEDIVATAEEMGKNL